MRRPIAGGLVLLVLLGACSAASERPGKGLTVVVTTTMLGDVVGNVVGEDAEVVTLLPIGADPHEFQLSARQIAVLSEADLVVTNGLGLEGPMNNNLTTAVSDGANLLEVGPLLDPLRLGDEDDPHVWIDPLRMADAASVIASEMTLIDGSVDWADHADVYGIELLELDAEIQRVLSVVAEDDRKLITNHESLRYFASRYNFTVVGTVFPLGASPGNPSSAYLADLVTTMEAEGADVIFAEAAEPTTLAETVADEVGGKVQVVELFIRSVGEPGSGAETLIDMLLTNARRIAEALGS